MRKAKLTIEKHLLPSCTDAIARHNAGIVFKLHDELTDAVMEFYKCAKRKAFRRKELLSVMNYCKSKIESDLNEVLHTNERGKRYRLHDTLRCSALDRLLKVTKEAEFLISNNPL